MGAEAKMRIAGKAAEEDARWYIDRCLHGAKNWATLHDVILFDKKGDTWCQIDHLVIGRLGHFLVLETKSAKEGMSLDKKSGAFTVWFNGRPKPVKSPIVQNERHIEVMRDFLKERDLLPRRLGMIPIQPVFLNWILVQPGARLPLEYDGARLVQRDQFSKALDKLIDSIGVPGLIRLMSRESLATIAKALEDETRENRKVCEIGNRIEAPPPIIEKPVPPRPPRTDEEKYGPPQPVPIPSPVSKPAGSGISCAKCSDELTHKEAAYCRYNFTKLGRQYLCRSCQ
ncbi:MAG: nuclease-related domain-containing protein [Bradyrhizobium sp.]